MRTPNATVVQMFESQATRRPLAVAVVSKQQSINYENLNRRSNQVAHYLGALGAGPEMLIGLCMDRSPDMVAALLGVLKSGAAYLPLDPMFPQDRLRFMIEDAQVRLIVTQTPFVDKLPSGVGLLLLDSESLASFGDWNPETHISTEQLAYVIYTSGSEGMPKGVEILHHSLANLLVAMQRTPGLTSTDLLLSGTTLSFDIAGLELFLPLATGACILLVDSVIAADPHALASAIDSYRPTVMQATPSTWSMLVDCGWNGNPGLKILCGGERLPTDLAAELIKRCASLWNLYGPTETTIWSTVHRVQNWHTSIPVGRPVDNTRVYILNSNLTPVQCGVSGEIFIGGAGVARGYLNRPWLTSERFLFDPFYREQHERMYRTGDLGRYLANGDLEVLGRLDDQIKLQGHRIEPGEIESALREHRDVKQAVVIARETPGCKDLVAYIVPSANSLDGGALREHLASRLPKYMIPSVFVAIDKLPLTPNQKIDRSALPAPRRATIQRNPR